MEIAKTVLSVIAWSAFSASWALDWNTDGWFNRVFVVGTAACAVIGFVVLLAQLAEA